MSELPELLRSVWVRVAADVEPPLDPVVHDDLNVIDQVDSFTIVNLLLETEAAIEQETGTYVTLADETIFDAAKSPLRRWADWVAYVEARRG